MAACRQHSTADLYAQLLRTHICVIVRWSPWLTVVQSGQVLIQILLKRIDHIWDQSYLADFLRNILHLRSSQRKAACIYESFVSLFLCKVAFVFGNQNSSQRCKDAPCKYRIVEFFMKVLHFSNQISARSCSSHNMPRWHSCEMAFHARIWWSKVHVYLHVHKPGQSFMPLGQLLCGPFESFESDHALHSFELKQQKQLSFCPHVLPKIKISRHI